MCNLQLKPKEECVSSVNLWERYMTLYLYILLFLIPWNHEIVQDFQRIKPLAFATLIYLKIFTGLSILLKVVFIVLFQNTEYRY